MSKLQFHLPFHGHHLRTHHQISAANAAITCSSMLNSCTDQRILRKIHCFIICNGFQNDTSMAAKLVSLYADYGFLNDAILVFMGGDKSYSFLWNSIIRAHVDSGFSTGAFFFYNQMQKAGIRPDNFTFPLLNRALSGLGNHQNQGEMIHCAGFKMGFVFDLYICNNSIEMYANLGDMVSAGKVFDEMPQRDLVSWTSIISGYVRMRNFNDASRFFGRMLMEESKPNSVTLLIMLQACSLSGNLVYGRQFHCYIIKEGFESYRSVQNSILTMYNKTGSFEDAEFLLSGMAERDFVSWNIMILGYALKGDVSMAAKSFIQMRFEKAIPTPETLTTLVSLYAKLGDLLQGKTIHSYAIKHELEDTFLQTALLDLYAKCGELAIAAQLFEKIPNKNCISWSVMIYGFAQNGFGKEAIELFHRMHLAVLKPGSDVLKSLVLASTQLGSLRMGKGIHGYLLRHGFYTEDASTETHILNMYAKCGDIVTAKICFDQMHRKDVIAWTSMIEGYGIHGHGSEALLLFDRMVKEGVEPNSVTFTSLLSACSHSGLVSEGCKNFDYMITKFGTVPQLNHYTCMVDLLGRSGQLEEALRIIKNMTVEPDSRIWGALLAACKIHSNTEIGLYAAKCLLDLEPENAGYHVVLSNVHAGDMKWSDAKNVREMMTEKKLKKKPGWSFVETGIKLHGFVAGDRSHPQAEKIYVILEYLSRHMEEAWFPPSMALIFTST